MKQKITLLLTMLICSYGLLFAQPKIAPTDQGSYGLNKLPTDWLASPSMETAVSNQTNLGGNALYTWVKVGSPQTIVGPNKFLSIFAKPTYPSSPYVKTPITGLIIGHPYEIIYRSMTSRYKINQIPQEIIDYYFLGFTIGLEGKSLASTLPPPFDSWSDAKTLNFKATKSDEWLVVAPHPSPLANTVLNFQVSNIIDLCKSGIDEVVLNSTKITPVCPIKTGDLTSTFTGTIPQGAELVWYTTSTHDPGTWVADPTKAPAGTYYAFFFDGGNSCFNTNNSTAAVMVDKNICVPPQVCKAGIDQAILSQTSVSASCPDLKFDLSTITVSNKPAATELVWFDNATHSNPKQISGADLQSVGPGTYYAFYYDAVANCYNTALSEASVQVKDDCFCAASIDGTREVQITTKDLTNVCNANTVNLNDALESLDPLPNTVIVWFDNPTHSNPTKIANPEAVGAGVYYPFYWDPIMDCYNTDLSENGVTVTIKACTDLTPSMQIDDRSFNKDAERDFVVKIAEINGGATSGAIQFTVTKLSGFDITFPIFSGNSNVSGSTPNENSNWEFSQNDNLIFIKSKPGVIIPANGQALIGFHIKRKDGVPVHTTQNITPTIVAGTGGDLNDLNNNTVTPVEANN